MAIGPRDEIFVLSQLNKDCFQGACEALITVDRYSRNGTEDHSFGANGDAVISLAPGRRFATAAIAVGRDGRPVVAATSGPDITLVRLDEIGRRDPTFGSAGSVSSDFGGVEAVTEIAVARDGKIVLGGSRLASDGELPLLARYQSDGSPDEGFGDRGFRVMGFASGHRVEGLALLRRGRIAAGVTGCCYSSSWAVVARFSANGDLDRRFARRGWKALLGGLSYPSIGEVLAGGGGRILAIGSEHYGGDAFASRFLFSGRIDRGFARKGIFRGLNLEWGAPATGVIEPSGRILLGAGGSLLRLRSNGRPDRTFAGGTGASSGPIDRTLAVGLQSSGRIVVLGSAGECIRSCSLQRVLVRYVGGASGARCRGQRANVVGTRASEEVIGTRGTDVIAALGGDDRVRGRGGRDLICGGAGDDELWGGGGRDRLVGGPGGDRIHQ